MEIEETKKKNVKALRAATPNIPEEVVNLWLVPFAEEGGFPVPKENPWDVKKTGEKVEFWNDAEWEKVTLDIPNLDYSQSHSDSMQRLGAAYLQGEQNSYWELLGEDGKKRYSRAFMYILKNRVFPQPPIFIITDLGKYEIIDGNHRLLGHMSAVQAHAEYVKSTPAIKKSFEEMIGVPVVEPPHALQEVWVCKPKWENSPAARSRKYLRDKGWPF